MILPLNWVWGITSYVITILLIHKIEEKIG